MKTKFLVAAAAAFVLLAGTVKASSLITNGTFTQTTLSGSNYWTGSNILTGWTTETSTTSFVYFQTASPGGLNATVSQGGSTFTIYNSATSNGNPSGPNHTAANANVVNVQALTTAAGITGNVIVADGGSPYQEPLSQTISGLTPNSFVTLTFEQAAGQQAGFGCLGPPSYPNSACTNEHWDVTFGSQTYYSPLMTNPIGGFQNWNAVSMIFYVPAGVTSEVLTFLADGKPDGTYPPVVLLADVSMSQGGTPEPASLAIMGLGLLTLGVVTRLRKRT
jgi:PEP-CTERM motif